jgi:hypothetical protein
MTKVISRWLALTLVLTSLFVLPEVASAATSCLSAQDSVIADSLSRGDVALATKARSMCSAPCKSILSFYQSSPKLSTYAQDRVMDAYTTCLKGSSNSNGNSNANGGTSSKTKCGGKIEPLKKPQVLGTLKVGKTLTYKRGVFTGCPRAFGHEPFKWFACNEPNGERYEFTTSQSHSIYPCWPIEPVGYGHKYKLSESDQGRYIQFCIDLHNSTRFGTYCPKTTKVVK